MKITDLVGESYENRSVSPDDNISLISSIYKYGDKCPYNSLVLESADIQNRPNSSSQKFEGIINGVEIEIVMYDEEKEINEEKEKGKEQEKEKEKEYVRVKEESREGVRSKGEKRRKSFIAPSNIINLSEEEEREDKDG